MGSVALQNVAKQFGTQVVLADASLDLHSGQITGLVGANGAGKTTLFRLITGELQPDTGTITRSKDLEIGYLPQEPMVDAARSLRDTVAEAFADLLAWERKLQDLSERMAARHDRPELDALLAEYDRVNARFLAAGGYDFEQRLNEILGGLGFRSNEHALPMSALSGGQNCRAALAKLLLQKRQFLLLDEPTNHLDIDAVRWLEKFLAGHHGGAVIVSHDRYLLDRVADRIIEIEAGRVTSYPGNYTNYMHVKKVHLLTQQRQYEKDQTFIEKERSFIAQHLGKQRTKEARGRRTRLERRLAAGEFVLEKRTEPRRSLRLRFDHAATRPSTALNIDGLGKAYGDKHLFTDMSFQLQVGQRLGITGPNGTGKTTLLKIILGEVAADAGRTQLDPKAMLGYYAQETTVLNADASVLDELRAVRPGLSERELRGLLSRFLFRGDDVFKRFGQLSGGEQSRIRLMKLILASPDFLVLDEPTNHLDIPSREALEEALADFPGTIIVSSHDRYLLDRLVDRLLVIRPEGHALYNGNYSFYVARVEQEQAAREAAAHAKKRGARPDLRERSRQPDGPTRNTSRYARLSLEELETLIIAREETVAALSQRFADPQVCRDRDALARLRAEFETVRRELAEAEAAWDERIQRER